MNAVQTENSQETQSKTSSGRGMDELSLKLRQLVRETCAHPANSLSRQKGLAQLVRLIQKSGKLWRESIPDYEDALQQTWIYVCRNLCEATTGDRFDPQKASVITWINAYLKRRLQDQQIAVFEARKRTVNAVSFEGNESVNPVEMIASPGDIPPILDEIREWVEADLDFKLRRTSIRDRPDINCQVLILRRLPPETPWEILAAEFKVSSATLSSFYSRNCIPLLRKFGQTQGYLEE